MAGHSKWANIQYRKGKQDAARGRIFTKLVREITVAARLGGSDPNANPRLRLAMDKAFAASMPKDNVERAIKKATGELEGVSYEEIRYEGYAPGGVAVIVDCLTDNRNRTVADVRHAFSKFGGNLGTDGSVAYQFSKLGVLSYAPGADEDRIIEAALEAGADDVQQFDNDGSMEVLTSPDNFEGVCAAMATAGLKPDEAEVTYRAENDVALVGEQAQTVARFLDWLDELDDVQNVYSNADLGEDAYG
ncbi:MAG: YebC/PmpR family DNA-binding transcriptional regulator [Xanthomonadales bacterium]|nr:YebC/PmpR family DNA-binding transcriptional regulator [Xanthomonadales bacterium]